MNKVVYDIETAAEDFDSLGKPAKDYVLRGLSTVEEKEKAKLAMAANPLISRVVSVGFLDVVDNVSKCYTLGKEKDYKKDGTGYLFCSSEKELLEAFWKEMAPIRKCYY